MDPKVTIGIPAYNPGKWIIQTLESALSQDWEKKEIIVIDSGSTDETPSILNKYKDKIKLISLKKTLGTAESRNLILLEATGEWIQYIDHDDYLVKGKIKTQFEEAKEQLDSADVLYSPTYVEIWKNGASIHPNNLLGADSYQDPLILWLSWDMPQIGSYIWRKQSLLKIGGWDNFHLCEDYSLYMRAITNKLKFVYCPTPGAVYRVGHRRSRAVSHFIELLKDHDALLEEMIEYLKKEKMLTEARQAAILKNRFQKFLAYKSVDLSIAEAYFKKHKELLKKKLPFRYRFALSLGLSFSDIHKIKYMSRRLLPFFKEK
ncbi:glycosyltransferase family 2 protein [Methylacidiphilum kamchatkense]|uniref:Glycosyl transferase family 2 n=1 Tax=Methylacidiphilum kamchatkense Kam1 TaxID=1202785 RepID=A0A516TP77_9BACT|nr:glycosyltransferase [Methylacidiphilum kamchatkense]QDQ43042.1 glycosyl transferase family 2 [Methylacidiphilum kamchatkense Kam1]